MFCATYYILPARTRMIETTPVTNRNAMVSLDKVASSLGRFLSKIKDCLALLVVLVGILRDRTMDLK